MSIPFWPRLRMSGRYRATAAANARCGSSSWNARRCRRPIDVALAGFSIEDFDLRLRARHGIEGRPPTAGGGPISALP